MKRKNDNELINNKKNKKDSNINSLPLGVKNIIFSYLNIQDIFNVFMTNEKYNNLIANFTKKDSRAPNLVYHQDNSGIFEDWKNIIIESTSDNWNLENAIINDHQNAKHKIYVSYLEDLQKVRNHNHTVPFELVFHIVINEDSTDFLQAILQYTKEPQKHLKQYHLHIMSDEEYLGNVERQFDIITKIINNSQNNLIDISFIETSIDIDEDTLIKLSDAIKNCNTLKKLNINNGTIINSEEYSTDFLSNCIINKNITTLSLNYNYFYDEGHEEDTLNLINNISKSNITKLSFRGSEFKISCSLSDFWKSLICYNSKLKFIDIDNTSLMNIESAYYIANIARTIKSNIKINLCTDYQQLFYLILLPESYNNNNLQLPLENIDMIDIDEIINKISQTKQKITSLNILPSNKNCDDKKYIQNIRKLIMQIKNVSFICNLSDEAIKELAIIQSENYDVKINFSSFAMQEKFKSIKTMDTDFARLLSNFF
jgi:hypothetical protein